MISMWYVDDDERMNATTNILFIAHFYAIWMEKHIFVKKTCIWTLEKFLLRLCLIKIIFISYQVFSYWYNFYENIFVAIKNNKIKAKKLRNL